MIKKFLLFTAVGWIAALGASEHLFQQRISEAKNGDYVVAEFNHMITIFAIRSNCVLNRPWV